MEGGSWRPAGHGDTGGDPPAGDWRSQLQPETRQRIVNIIMETLQRHLPISAPEGLTELKKIVVRSEEKIYTAATSKAHYTWKITVKIISMVMEIKAQNPQAINPSSMNPAAWNQGNVDAASVGIHSQVGNQGPSLPIVNQSLLQQPHLAQNLTNNTPSALIQVSSGLPAPVPSMSGMPQSTISNGGQPSSLQNMSVMSQNSINCVNSLSGATQNNYANAQRQMQGRQQPQSTMSQHQQQSQNSLIHQQQLQQQLLEQTIQHLLQLHTQQQQQQQQSLLQQSPLQPLQQPLMQMSSSMPASQTNIQQSQPTMMQPPPQSGLQQNQQNSVQQSIPSLLQQNSTSVVRQHLGQPTIHQQSTPLQQQASSVAQQSMLASQQQQQLLGQQTNMSSMQQNQLLGQQNSVSDLQQQQQQRLSRQQNNLFNMQQSQYLLNQQYMSLDQYLSLDQQQQQQQQQQQLLGNQPGISNMQPHQHPGQILQQNKTAVQQQTQQSSLAMLQSQSQQSQHQSSLQQLMPQIQTQPGQLQQLGMQQQANPLQREMQQRCQASGALIQSQNAIDQRKQFIQSQRLPEVSSSTSLDSTAQTGNVGVVDWQEEIYQKIKTMELYFSELNELCQKLPLNFQQCENQNLLPHGKQSELIEKMKNFLVMLERSIAFLQLSKSSIQPALKEKLPLYQRQISSTFLASDRKPRNIPPQTQFQPPGGHAQSMPQQQSSQVSQLQPQDGHVSRVQQMNLQVQGSSFGSLQPASFSSVQQSAVGALQNGD
ncbi:hypothetical protein J5N97_022416 [Dioscorea zingiberensis]|uniref:Mediator complex subunit 15 KIX domain-containing protein n=1 Tax=Dioscorea zingiberensis TaxID=325984 RepID=A0A9D5CAR8_9LILI|nr:hypothetical protein J5N97_022416 [Dioscorea zingiberensis]